MNLTQKRRKTLCDELFDENDEEDNSFQANENAEPLYGTITIPLKPGTNSNNYFGKMFFPSQTAIFKKYLQKQFHQD